MGNINNAYYWVDDHPISFGNHGTWDPNIYKYIYIYATPRQDLCFYMLASPKTYTFHPVHLACFGKKCLERWWHSSIPSNLTRFSQASPHLCAGDEWCILQLCESGKLRTKKMSTCSENVVFVRHPKPPPDMIWLDAPKPTNQTPFTSRR